VGLIFQEVSCKRGWPGRLCCHSQPFQRLLGTFRLLAVGASGPVDV